MKGRFQGSYRWGPVVMAFWLAGWSVMGDASEAHQSVIPKPARGNDMQTTIVTPLGQILGQAAEKKS